MNDQIVLVCQGEEAGIILPSNGLVYADDYVAHWHDRSLVDKIYIDSHFLLDKLMEEEFNAYDKQVREYVYE